jgi:hypothetical protein
MSDTVVFTRRGPVEFTPPDSPRSYMLAPLSYRERQAFRAEMLRDVGLYPAPALMLEALRDAVRTAAPANLAELLAAIDAAEAAPEDAAAAARLTVVEGAFTGAGGYGDMLAARHRYIGLLPFYAARHALRGWSGPDLPDFTRVRGLVPLELLDELPPDELEAVGYQASALMQVGGSTAKN